jgi:apoptosis-inducing factor 3
MPRQEHVVASLDALAPGTMRQVEVEGLKILLARDGDTVFAVDATCPHAGGPLAEGVRRGDRVVCPWHKAAFCLKTGAVLDPPAVDRLRRYDARIDGGHVLVTLPATDVADAPLSDDRRCFVIVGAGAAGAVAAQTLREAGFGGRIVMLDQDNRVPYDRTVLSKYFLSGETGGEKSPLQSQAYYRDHRIERRTAEVTHVDPRARRITCADGSVLDYDAVLLATGAAPKRPSLPGIGLRNVFMLRSRADADAILAQAERSERAVVLGASFIGMEVAASLRERGLDVTVVGLEKAPFARQLGERIGSVFVSLHQKRGVTFRLGSGVIGLEGDGVAQAVRLEDGTRVEGDLVVVGFGVSPVTGYARDLPRGDDGGLAVDACLRITDGVYAAGDIARFPLRGDGAAIRVEHWRVAQQQGRVAALNMIGRAVQYDAVPVFWTIQYLKRLDYVGHAPEWDDIAVFGDTAKPEFLAYYVKDGKVAAAAGFDRDRDTAALIELFTIQRDWTAKELGDNPAAILAAREGEPR